MSNHPPPVQDARCCQTCLPYNDPLIITAQIISIIAALLNYGFWITLLIGFICMLLLQCVWCCRMTKGGFIAAAIFAIIAGCGSLTASILMVVNKSSYYSTTTMNDDYYYDGNWMGESYVLSATLGFVSTGLWTLVTLLIFIFCNTRYDKYQMRFAEEDSNNSNNVEMPPAAAARGTATAVAVPMGAAQPATAKEATPTPAGPTTITVEETYNVDGQPIRKTIKRTPNTDGSITVVETVETTDFTNHHDNTAQATVQSVL